MPFTFSIESIRNADQNKIKIGINELYQRVEWLGPEDEISNIYIYSLRCALLNRNYSFLKQK